MACLPRLKPRKFYDLVVEVAIIRPGPIVGKLVHPYLNRRQGREPVTYPHPSLKPVLERTLGVPLFQEQLLRMAMTVAGFSGGEAEELRRAFGFKRPEHKMSNIEVKLRRGMEKNGIAGKVQDEVVRSISSFALYGFPESHAASFALLSYASAYLKCHYLAAFTAALLNNQPMGFYHPSTLIKDAQRHGQHFLPVDVTQSMEICTLRRIDGGKLAVRLGLNYVKGLRSESAKAIVEERTRGPFRSIQDLVNRVPTLNKNELPILAEAGALNALQPDHKAHRRAALWDTDLATRPAGPLFADETASEERSPLAPMTPEERLIADFRNTKLSIGPHPMRLYRKKMRHGRVRTAAQLAGLRDGMTVSVAGAVITRQRPGTAKGFLFLTLEDETGVSNIIVTPGMFQRNRATIVGEQFLLIDGVLQNQDGVIHVRAGRIRPLVVDLTAAESHDFH
jgi:error-prone DNA polymerase